MKTKTIILFLILHGFLFAASSQNRKDGFDIYIDKHVTWFDDVNFINYKGSPPKNAKGQELGNPSSKLSTIEKYKEIETDVFTAEEVKRLREKYTPVIMFILEAKSGKILAVTFTFRNLPDSSLIDTKKLAKFRKRVMAELSYNELLFDGYKAASGYMLAGFMMFKPMKNK